MSRCHVVTRGVNSQVCTLEPVCLRVGGEIALGFGVSVPRAIVVCSHSLARPAMVFTSLPADAELCVPFTLMLLLLGC